MKTSKPLAIALAALTALALLTGAVAAPILCRPFYYAHIGPLRLAERTGYTEGEIKTAFDEMLDYCLGGEEFSTGAMRWSESGKSHFTDVRRLFLLDLRAFAAALGDKRGIARYGHALLPMDEALILAAVDLSGRDILRYGLDIPTQKVGTFDTELVEEFLLAFVRNAGVTLHLRQLDGTNSHHIIESAFKALARALRMAVAIDPAQANEIPSTKGVL